MPSLNFAAQGFTGPSTFFLAGDEHLIEIDSVGLSLSGGVFLGSETNLAAEDPTVYATASNFDDVHPGEGLTKTIEIDFAAPIHNFSVTIFNGFPDSATYQVNDNMGDSTSVILGPNSSSNNAQSVFLTDTHGSTKIFISASGSDWDFSIDNIVFDTSTTDIQIPKASESAIGNINIPIVLIYMSELADLLSPSSATNSLRAIEMVGLIFIEMEQIVLGDPFDPNYKQPYVPTFAQLPTIQPDSTVTQQTANDANTAM